MKEMIALHVGQAGCQIGNACWELFCLEHGVQPDGNPLSEDCGPRPLFSESWHGKQVPRAMYIDLEPSVVDEVRRGAYRELFHPDCMFTWKEDAANNFARGYHAFRYLKYDCEDRIRKLMENCNNLQGFLIFSSVSGGTGSGFLSLIAQRYNNYGSNLAFTLYPSPQVSTEIVSPYNSVLATNHFLDGHAMRNATVMLDNEAIHNIARRRLGIEKPTYANINRLIAQVVSSVTASLRFDGALNVDIEEMLVNIVPYGRIQFVLPSFAPLRNVERAYHERQTVTDITLSAFEYSSFLVDAHPEYGRFMACLLMYRGDVVPKDVNEAVRQIKCHRKIHFVDWCPTGFKCGVNYQPQTTVPECDLADMERSVCMLANHSEVGSIFERINKKYDLLFTRRAFTHWFIDEGMEPDEFSEARENMAALQRDYEEVSCNDDSLYDSSYDY